MPFGYFENLVVSAHTPAINAQIRWQTINAMRLQRCTAARLHLPAGAAVAARGMDSASSKLHATSCFGSNCDSRCVCWFPHLARQVGGMVGWLVDLVDRSLSKPLLGEFFFCHCRLLLLPLLMSPLLLLLLLWCDLFHLAVVPSVFFHFVGN